MMGVFLNILLGLFFGLQRLSCWSDFGFDEKTIVRQWSSSQLSYLNILSIYLPVSQRIYAKSRDRLISYALLSFGFSYSTG